MALQRSLTSNAGQGYGQVRRGAGAPAGFADQLSPEQIQLMKQNANLGYQALPQIQGELTPDQAAMRFGQEQQRGEAWDLGTYNKAQGRYDALPMGELDNAIGRSSKWADKGTVPDWLLEKMYQRQAGVIEGETQRGQSQIQEGLANRGLAGSGQGLGSIAGMARNRMQSLTNAKRDVDIWGATENLKAKERANSSLNQLMALRADIAGRRAELDMSLRMTPSDYSGFTKTPMTFPGVSMGGGGGGGTDRNRGRVSSQKLGGGKIDQDLYKNIPRYGKTASQMDAIGGNKEGVAGMGGGMSPSGDMFSSPFGEGGRSQYTGDGSQQNGYNASANYSSDFQA